MKIREALSRLKAAGTEQNRKVYARHGVGKKMYGVSYAEQKKLAKEIGTDHELAVKLWESGNHDARILCSKVADPAQMKSGQIDSWARELDNYVVTDAFADLVAAGPFARSKADRWRKSKNDWLGQAGWNVTAALVTRGDLTNTECLELLAAIEAGIDKAGNRTRHSMNMVLMCVGGRSKTLWKRAIAAANRIGTVEVDHGETSCKTPAAVPYMEKMWARKEAQAAKAKKAGR